MNRRLAAIGGMRRDIRGGGGGGAPALTITQALQGILGAKLYEVWDPAYGYTLVGGNVDHWLGQNAGIDWPAPSALNRPLWEAAGWKGKASILCDGLTQYLMSPLISLASTTRPYLFASLQYVSLPLATTRLALALYHSAHPGSADLSFRIPTAGTYTAFILDASGSEIVTSTVAMTTAQRQLEAGMTALAADRLVVDGTSYAGTLAGATGVVIDELYLGGFFSGTNLANVRAGLVVLCKSEPTASEKAAVRALLTARGY